MRPLFALVWVSMAIAASSAHADTGEHVLSISAGYGRVSVPDHNPGGGVLGLDYERGVTESLWLRGSASGGLYRESGATAYSGHAVLGITYALDILEYVPYANLGIGAIALGGSCPEQVDEDCLGSTLKPLVEVGAGIDVLVSRHFSYGAVARFESFTGDTAFVTVSARLSWRWGFF